MSHEFERYLVCIQLISVMAAMGAKLSARDFLGVFARPISLSWGLVCQFVASPILAVGAVHLGVQNPQMAVGLLLVSAMPGGPMSTLFTHIGRGNAALAVSLTALTTLLSVVTLPITLPLLAGASAAKMELPANVILRETVLFLFIPLAMGQALRRVSPTAANFVARWGVRLGTTLLLCYVVLSLTSGRIRPAAFGWTPALTIIVFCIVCMQAAMLPFRLFRWPPRDRLAVGIEMTIRDINLAVLLKTSLDSGAPIDHRGDPMLYGILFYAGAALIIAGLTAIVFRFVLDPDRKKTVDSAPPSSSPNRSDSAN
jgi:bile acid:Na+ symporter, BASS family